MTPAEQINAHVAQLTATGMLRVDIARAAGIDPSMLSKYARGLRSPKPATLTRILAITPTSTLDDPDGMSTTDRILEEWEFMRGPLGLPGEYVIHRLSGAFGLSVPHIREVVGGSDDHT